MSIFDTFMVAMLAAALVAGLAADVWLLFKSGKITPEAAQEIALSVISRVALALVTDAERAYGSGTGELKMSSCMERLLELLPASVVETVPKAFLQEHLEKALEIAKSKWLRNPRLLNKEE